MVVVMMRAGIIAIALGVTVFGCSKELEGYKKKAKKSEAVLQLHMIEKRMKVLHAEQAQFPTLSVPVPTQSCCGSGHPQHKCESIPAEWDAWRELDFYIDEPRYYQYGITSTPTGFVARAVGDLDCDGMTSEYTLVGEVVEGNVRTILTEPDRVD
jgi:hypothetical protein